MPPAAIGIKRKKVRNTTTSEPPRPLQPSISLPATVLEQICRDVEDDASCLRAIACASKQLYDIATPLLYRHIHITSHAHGMRLFAGLDKAGAIRAASGRRYSKRLSAQYHGQAMATRLANFDHTRRITFHSLPEAGLCSLAMRCAAVLGRPCLFPQATVFALSIESCTSGLYLRSTFPRKDCLKWFGHPTRIELDFLRHEHYPYCCDLFIGDVFTAFDTVDTFKVREHHYLCLRGLLCHGTNGRVGVPRQKNLIVELTAPYKGPRSLSCSSCSATCPLTSPFSRVEIRVHSSVDVSDILQTIHDADCKEIHTSSPETLWSNFKFVSMSQ